MSAWILSLAAVRFLCARIGSRFAARPLELSSLPICSILQPDVSRPCRNSSCDDSWPPATVELCARALAKSWTQTGGLVRRHDYISPRLVLSFRIQDLSSSQILCPVLSAMFALGSISTSPGTLSESCEARACLFVGLQNHFQMLQNLQEPHPKTGLCFPVDFYALCSAHRKIRVGAERLLLPSVDYRNGQGVASLPLRSRPILSKSALISLTLSVCSETGLALRSSAKARMLRREGLRPSPFGSHHSIHVGSSKIAVKAARIARGNMYLCVAKAEKRALVGDIK